MMFATIEEVKQIVNNADFEKLDDTHIQGYIERADIYIIARTRCDYSKATDKALKNKLKIATGKTVRYLFMLDTSKMIQKKMDENRLKFSASIENKSETITLCEHIETGAIGIIKNELKGNGKFPDQWGIYWIKKANSGKFGNHYYWNDKNLIKKK